MSLRYIYRLVPAWIVDQLVRQGGKLFRQDRHVSSQLIYMFTYDYPEEKNVSSGMLQVLQPPYLDKQR